VGRIVTGKSPFGPRGDFEAVSREGVVYARCVGQTAETQAEQTTATQPSDENWEYEHTDDWDLPRNGGIDDWPND
jgi:hypothetical protein